MFWCNCRKGYTRKDVVRRSRTISRMQRKSISNSSADVFNARKAAVYPLSVQWIYICILLLKRRRCLAHIQKHFTSALHAMLGFSNVKKSAKNRYLAPHLLSLNRWAKFWFCSFDKAPVSLRGPLSPTSFLMIAHRCSNWTNVPVLPSPPQAKHQINECVKGRHLMWLTANETYLNTNDRS